MKNFIIQNKKKSAIIVMAIILIITLTSITTIYFSADNIQKRKIKAFDKTSEEIISNVDIQAQKNKLKVMQETLVQSERCVEYNIERRGTTKKPMQCNEFLTFNPDESKQTNEDSLHSHEHVNENSNVVLADEIMNLPWCRRVQWEYNHIKKYDPQNPGGWGWEVYATDIACTKWESSRIYVTGHDKEYKVHYNWFLKWGTWNTVILKSWNKSYLYGHTDSELKVGDTVYPKDFIWATDKSWVTTNYHLHFEMWDWENNVSKKWEINPKSKDLHDKRWNIEKKSITDFLVAHKASNLEEHFLDSAQQYNLKPELLVCITKAETNVGSKLKTPHNYGNVGNNDRWDKVWYDTPREWIDAIARMIATGTYLKWNMTLWDLSTQGPTEDTKRYASDPNWVNNMSDCLSKLYWKNITKSYIYKK